MANTVEKGWLYSRNGNMFSPTTLIESVYTRSGTPYDEHVRGYIASVQRVNATSIASLEAASNEHYTRLNALENKTASLDNINVDDSDSLYVIDNSGHVIMSVDKDGIHSVDVTTPYYGSMSSLTADVASLQAQINGLDSNLSNIMQNINADDSNTLYIVDKSNNVIAYVDKSGVHSVDVASKNYNLENIGLRTVALEKDLDQEKSDRATEDATLQAAISILEDKTANLDSGDSDTLYVTDKADNVIAYVDKSGVHSVDVASKNYNLENIGAAAAQLRADLDQKSADLDAADATLTAAVEALQKKVHYVSDATTNKYFTVTNGSGTEIGYFNAYGFHATKISGSTYELDKDIGNLYKVDTELASTLESTKNELAADIASMLNGLQLLEQDLKAHLNWDDSNAFYIVDNNEQVVAYVDATGLHAIDMYVGAGDNIVNIPQQFDKIDESFKDLQNKIAEGDADLDSRVINLEKKSEYVVSPTSGKCFTVVDSNSKEIGYFGSDGFHASQINSAKYNLDTVIDDLKKADQTLQSNINTTNTTLQSVQSSLSADIATNAANLQSFKDELANYMDWADSDTFYIIDNNQNVVAYINNSGLYAINVSYKDDDGSMQDVKLRFSSVDTAIQQEAGERATEDAAINSRIDTFINTTYVNDKQIQSNVDSQQSEKISSLESECETLTTTTMEIWGQLSDFSDETNATLADHETRISANEAKLKNVTTVMDFVGTINPSTTSGYQKGDVGISGNKEYVFDGSKWVEFGDVTAEASAITDLKKLTSEHTEQIKALQTDLASTNAHIDEIDEVVHLDHDEALYIADKSQNVVAVFDSEGLNTVGLRVKGTDVMGAIDSAADNAKSQLDAAVSELNTTDATIQIDLNTHKTEFNTFKINTTATLNNHEARIGTLEGNWDTFNNTTLPELREDYDAEIASIWANTLYTDLSLSSDNQQFQNHEIGVTGTLPVLRGGTGTSTFGSNYGMIYYDSSKEQLASLTNGEKGKVLVSNDKDGKQVPSFQSLSVDNLGTTREHIVNLYVGDTTASSFTIPLANGSQSGLMSIEEQIFAGKKTFQDGLDLNNQSIANLAGATFSDNKFFFSDNKENVIAIIDSEGIKAVDFKYGVDGTSVSAKVAALEAEDASIRADLTNTAKDLQEDINTRVLRKGDTMTGQLKTSFKSSVAMGSYASTATTVEALVEEIRYSSGCMGSVQLGIAYNSISAGWYNFVYSPHRTGGLNGGTSGDNTSYGTLLLFGMTDNFGGWRIRVASGSIAEVARIIDTSYTGTLANSISGNAATASKLGTATIGASNKPIYLSEGAATACSLYAGGTAVTLNGSSKAASTASFYAPTTVGSSGYVLKSSGSGAPTWVNALDKFQWTNGVIDIAVAGTSKSLTIPAASSTASGIVTTGAQSFAGTKTFNGDAYFGSKIVLSQASYGASLPSSGTEGQIFFLLIE